MSNLYGLALRHEELSPVRKAIVSSAEELGEVVKNYSIMLTEPMPQRQRDYWNVMQNFYAPQR
jgi:hypothetical protein